MSFTVALIWVVLAPTALAGAITGMLALLVEAKIEPTTAAFELDVMVMLPFVPLPAVAVMTSR